jgi:hypothetical protein
VHGRTAKEILARVEPGVGGPNEDSEVLALQLQVALVHAVLDLSRNVYIVAEQLAERL